MGRRPRIHFSGAVYHVMSRGVDRRSIFIDDHDRRHFLDSLNRLCGQTSVDRLAYCLMGNHFHLALQVGAIPLSVVMQRLETGYATAFNGRHGRSGHLFEGRYHSNLCTDDAYLSVLIRYIHQNPVRAGLVATAGDWHWSSYKQIEGSDEAVPDGFEPWGKPQNAISMSRFIDRPKFEIAELGLRIQAQTGIGLIEMQSPGRRRVVVAARRALTLEAIRNGHALNSIARWLQSTKSSVARYSLGHTATTGRPDTI